MYFYKYILICFIILTALFCTGGTSRAIKKTVYAVNRIEYNPAVYYPEYRESRILIPLRLIRYQKYRNEVELFWIMYLKDNKVPETSRKYIRIRKFAEYVAEATIRYENAPTNIGGQLPRDSNSHLIIASMITYETDLNPLLVGKRGEVGLMQVMWHARIGFSKRRVMSDPKLGVMLGTRWLAYSASFCKNPKGNWEFKHWVKPLGVYGAGLSKARHGKYKRKCKSFSFARRRVRRAIKYHNLITAKRK